LSAAALCVLPGSTGRQAGSVPAPEQNDPLRRNEGQECENKKNVNKYLRKRERCKMQNITESERLWEQLGTKKRREIKKRYKVRNDRNKEEKQEE